MSQNLQRKALKACRYKLKEDLDEVSPVIKSMIHAGTLSTAEVAAVNSRTTRTDQAQLLLDIVENRGNQSYPSFRAALGKYYPQLAEALDIVAATSIAMKYGIEIPASDASSIAIVCAAVKKGYHGAVRELLNAKVGFHRRWQGMTPLETACKYNRETSAMALYDQGADLTLSALHLAVTHGSSEAVTFVLTHIDEVRMLVDNEDRDGWTALHHACHTGHHAVVRLLLAKDASLTAQTRAGETPLHFAASLKDSKCAEILFEHQDQPHVQKKAVFQKMDVSSKGGTDDDTPLHLACKNGADEDLVRLLIDNEADVNAQNKFLQTPLHVAIRSTHWNSAVSLDALLQWSTPRLSIPDEDGVTPKQLIEDLPEEHEKAQVYELYREVLEGKEEAEQEEEGEEAETPEP